MQMRKTILGLTMLMAALVLVAVPLVAPRRSTADAQGYSFANPRFYWVSPGQCNSSVSGNGTGTNGLTTTGASVLPVVQAQTSNTGTNTHTYICNITPPASIITTGTGLSIVDAIFFYGVQTTGLGTQVSTGSSGTYNSATVFSYIAYPTPATGETASTVTPVRADAGTLVYLPTAANANVATTTAGAFYSQKFTPATPIAFKTDLRQLLLTVPLLNTATSATVTNSSGVMVHYRGN